MGSCRAGMNFGVDVGVAEGVGEISAVGVGGIAVANSPVETVAVGAVIVDVAISSEWFVGSGLVVDDGAGSSEGASVDTTGSESSMESFWQATPRIAMGTKPPRMTALKINRRDR